MTLTRWQRTDGWRPAGFWQPNTLTEEVGQLLEAFGRAVDSPSSWSPPVDLYEHNDLVTVKAEIPGLKKEDINIMLQEDALVLSGERKRPHFGQNAPASGELAERFERTVSLPYKVNAGAIKAAYVDGILSVELPKAEEAKPKRIEVKFK